MRIIMLSPTIDVDIANCEFKFMLGEFGAIAATTTTFLHNHCGDDPDEHLRVLASQLKSNRYSKLHTHQARMKCASTESGYINNSMPRILFVCI